MWLSAVEKSKAGSDRGQGRWLQGRLWFSIKTLLQWWCLSKDAKGTLLQTLRKYLEYLNLKTFKFYCKYGESPGDASVLQLSQGDMTCLSSGPSQWVWVRLGPDFRGPEVCHWPCLCSCMPEVTCASLVIPCLLFLCVSVGTRLWQQPEI